METSETTVNERVIQAYNELKRLGIVKNKTAFANAGKFLPTYWAGYEKGFRKVSVEVAANLAKQFGMNLTYLLRGEGELFQQSEKNNQIVEKINSTVIPVGPIEPAGYAYLRFVPIVARATFAEMGDTPRVDEFDTIAVPIQPNDDLRTLDKCWVFEVNGDSMEETLHHGQRIVAAPVNEGDWEYQSDRVFVVSYAGYLVVKRIKTNDLRKHGYLELWSDNEKKGGMKVAQRREIKGIWKVLRLDRAPEIY
jgi:phage repressor protein C with HTH and peptisase S24 domain